MTCQYLVFCSLHLYVCCGTASSQQWFEIYIQNIAGHLDFPSPTKAIAPEVQLAAVMTTLKTKKASTIASPLLIAGMYLSTFQAEVRIKGTGNIFRALDSNKMFVYCGGKCDSIQARF